VLKRYVQKDVGIKIDRCILGLTILIINVMWLSLLEISGGEVKTNSSDGFSESFWREVDDYIFSTSLFGDFGIFISVVKGFDHFIHFLLVEVVHKFPVSESEFTPKFFLVLSGFEEFAEIMSKVLIDNVSSQ